MEKMTTNELADVFNTYDEPHDWGIQAQAMLRKQQAEIEALKNARDYWCLAYKDKFNQVEMLNTQIESLIKWKEHCLAVIESMSQDSKHALNPALRTYDGKAQEK